MVEKRKSLTEEEKKANKELIYQAGCVLGYGRDDGTLHVGAQGAIAKRIGINTPMVSLWWRGNRPIAMRWRLALNALINRT